MTILVTGGAGYIGSHATYALLDRGEKVVVLDNLSTGLRGLVGDAAIFIKGEVNDSVLVDRILREHRIEAVFHFAGSIVVPDSIATPLDYYANNIVAAHALIWACVKEGVKKFIFSSTAAVYGLPDASLVAEDMPLMPINPYGRSKLMTEWVLEDAARAYDFRYIALRYFNVAGADAKGRTGQSNPRATHLIKRACQVALGRLPHLDIFGTDYPTPDGTGVRDYIHVSDLVSAHLLAFDALRSGARSAVYNCGYGKGLSVRDVIGGVERVTGRKLPVVESPRRPGDPPILVADPAGLKAALHWTPKYADLEEIIRSALEWERRINA